LCLVVFESFILLFLEELRLDCKERLTDAGTYTEVLINGFNWMTTGSLSDVSFILEYIFGEETTFS
jgi:hypothetical protein